MSNKIFNKLVLRKWRGLVAPLLAQSSRNGENLLRRYQIRFFSFEKAEFIQDLNACHLTVLAADFSVIKMLEVAKEMQDLEEKYKEDTFIESEVEVIAYNIKKRFLSLEKEIPATLDEEISKIKGLVLILAERPDWIVDREELVEILDYLRPLVATIFSAIGKILRTGHIYLRPNNELMEFPLTNKVFMHAAEVKTALGTLTASLKVNLPYFSLLLKDIQRRWSWLDDEQREEVIAKLQLAIKEKKKVAKERKRERKRQDKITKEYLASFSKKD